MSSSIRDKYIEYLNDVQQHIREYYYPELKARRLEAERLKEQRRIDAYETYQKRKRYESGTFYDPEGNVIDYKTYIILKNIGAYK